MKRLAKACCGAALCAVVGASAFASPAAASEGALASAGDSAFEGQVLMSAALDDVGSGDEASQEQGDSAPTADGASQAASGMAGEQLALPLTGNEGVAVCFLTSFLAAALGLFLYVYQVFCLENNV